MKVATWNVNGARARAEQLTAWLAAERPDVVCLQEIKARPEQLPETLSAMPGYWSCWHGSGGYSGVALLLSRETFPAEPSFAHPDFDFEERIVTAQAGDLLLASIYVPNGGKDFSAKLRFLDDLTRWAGDESAAGRALLLCGDLNITREERDVHPKERKAGAIGQRPEERQRLADLLAAGFLDLGRHFAPDDDALFTWWAPWRNLRQRNIGWRIDYLLASAPLAEQARGCKVQRTVGSSDHAPVVAELD